eukprot:4308938-Amphidinium_carterae.2
MGILGEALLKVQIDERVVAVKGLDMEWEFWELQLGSFGISNFESLQKGLRAKAAQAIIHASMMKDTTTTLSNVARA